MSNSTTVDPWSIINAAKEVQQNLFMQTPIPLCLFMGSEHVFTIANDHYARFVGRNVIGKKIREVFTEEDGKDLFLAMDNVYKTGESFIGTEISFGELFINTDYHPFRDHDGLIKGIFAYTQDVTSRVKLREKVAESNEKYQTAIDKLELERDLREKFVSTLTHDLRSPLTAVKISSQLVLRKARDEVSVRRLSARIIENIQRADRMIEDLLDANRIKAGETLPVETSPLDFVNVVKEFIGELATIHGDRFQLSGPDSIKGVWDKTAIERIIDNLCNNAIKYGSKFEPVNITLTNIDCIELRVHNIGSFINKDEQKTLFNQYRRSGAADAGKQRGWGIGLALVKGLTESMHGNVNVESSEYHGTTFVIQFPNQSLIKNT